MQTTALPTRSASKAGGSTRAAGNPELRVWSPPHNNVLGYAPDVTSWETGSMVFVADDLAAWLIGLLADAGRKKLTALVLGTDQERALRSAATAAVRLTAEDLRPGNNEQIEHLALVISQVFSEPLHAAPITRHETVIEALQEGITKQLAVLDDASLTGTGQSSADVLGVTGVALAEKLTACLTREIVIRGARGGPLFPLASQLNDDLTHLQGRQLHSALRQLRGEILNALARVDAARTVAATPVERGQLPATIASPAKVACPPMLVNLPERPELFVGRVDELYQLDKSLARLGGVVVQAVHGLGGIGKSALAARWGSLNFTRYNPVWWISADTQAAIDGGLASLALALNTSLGRALPPETLREWAVQWLATHKDWLVILDNVNDPSDVKALLARTTTGRFLITSRRATGWHGIATPIKLGLMKEGEAVELLVAIGVSRGLSDLTEAAMLCEELGYLPLAVEQAGAYLTETGINARDYMDLLARYPAEMYRETAEGGDASRTVARIWDATLDRFVDEPLAGELLRILAWYAPDRIPRRIVDEAGQQLDVLRALGRLAAYSMIVIDGEFISMHRLVQAVARTSDTKSPYRTAGNIADARLRATALLEAALPDDDTAEAWSAWEALLPHIDALASHVPPESDTGAIANIITRGALFRIGVDSDVQAIPYLERALDFCGRVLGYDHRATMACWNNLAFAYFSTGELTSAIFFCERNLEDHLQVLGRDHPDTLISRNNLAYAYQLSGDPARAIPLYEENLEDRIRILGPEHPKTLASRNNLAHAYKSAGDPARAIPLYERNLEDRIRILGPEHPKTLASRNNLAHAYMSAGDLARATSLFERNVDDGSGVLPNRSTLTESSRLGLAAIKWMRGSKLLLVALRTPSHAA